MNYRIVSGQLTVSKRFFGKESLKPGSHFRRLMGLDGQWSKKVRHIERDGEMVHIHYEPNDSVYFTEDFSTFLKKVKETYGDEIQGQLNVSKLRGGSDFLDLTFKL